MNKLGLAVSTTQRILLLVVTVALSITTAHAQLSRFHGDWVNVDAASEAIASMKIDVTGARVTVHAFGRCVPRDCDWGLIAAHAYTPDGVDADLAATATTISAVHNRSFAVTILIIELTPQSLLRVERYTSFHDGSQRANLTGVEFMRRR